MADNVLNFNLPKKPRFRVPAGSSRVTDSFINLQASLAPGYGNGQATVNIASAGTFGFNPISRNRILLEWAYRGSWIVRAAVDAVADDLMREGVDFQTTENPQDIEVLQEAFKRLRIPQSISNCCRWARLYGGCIAVMMIEGQDLEEPLRIETVGKGQFHGLMVLDRWLVQPSLEDLVDIPGPHFGLPRYYDVVGDYKPIPNERIHYSRVVRIDGENLPFWQKIAENGWGLSVLEPLWDRLLAYDSTSQGIAQMAYTARLRVVRMKDLRANVAAGGKKLQGIAAMMQNLRMTQSNEGITLLDLEDEFESCGYNFGGLSDIMKNFETQLAGATRIPLVRLFGQSPGGLDASGDVDIRNYYDSIRQEQEGVLRGPLTTIFEIMHYSELGHAPDDGFSFEFAPLWQLDEKEKAEVNAAITQSIIQAFEAGAVAQKTCLAELRQASRITGIWSNIDDAEVGSADDVPPMQRENETADPGLTFHRQLGKLAGTEHRGFTVTPEQQAGLTQLQTQSLGHGVWTKPPPANPMMEEGNEEVSVETGQGPQEAAQLAEAHKGEIAALHTNLVLAEPHKEEIAALYSKVTQSTMDGLTLLHKRIVLDVYDPSELRVPKGSPKGGQWTKVTGTEANQLELPFEPAQTSFKPIQSKGELSHLAQRHLEEAESIFKYSDLSRDTKEMIEGNFPGLHEGNYEVVKEPSQQYNCVAVAFDDYEHWWWPGESFWPGDNTDKSVEAFEDIIEDHANGVPSKDGYEPGFVKVALFAEKTRYGISPTHMARLLPNGKWLSKLGPECGITHELNDMEGGLYGEVYSIYKIPEKDFVNLKKNFGIDNDE